MTESFINPFIGNTERPTDEELSLALVDARPLWDKLIADLAADHAVVIQEWRSYSPKAGWSLRLKRGKRTILWLAPGNGCFQATFILGAKALVAAQGLSLAVQTRLALDQAVKYPEGAAVRLPIRRPKDLPQVGKLASVKIAH